MSLVVCQGHMQCGACTGADLTPEQEVGELRMREEVVVRM